MPYTIKFKWLNAQEPEEEIQLYGTWGEILDVAVSISKSRYIREVSLHNGESMFLLIQPPPQSYTDPQWKKEH